MHAAILYSKEKAVAVRTVHGRNSSKKKRKKVQSKLQQNNLLRALASTTSSVVAERASGANSRAALADVVADIVVATADLAVNGGLVLGTTDALEIGGLGLLAGGGVDVAALGEGDGAVVGRAGRANLDLGAGELLLDVLVHAGLLGCEGGRRLVLFLFGWWNFWEEG